MRIFLINSKILACSKTKTLFSSILSSNSSSNNFLSPLLTQNKLFLLNNIRFFGGSMGTNGDFKVLFCGEEFPSAENLTKEYLKDDPHIKVEHVSRAALEAKIGEYDVVIPRMSRISEDLILKAKKTKLICQFGVGLEGVDIDAATRAKILVARISGQANPFNAISCAEHCIYLMMTLLRKQAQLLFSFENRMLGEPIGDTLYGKTVLIIGYGAIGKELAVRLKPFNVSVLATKRSWETKKNPEDAPLVDEWGGPSLQGSFLERADIVVLACPLSPHTRGMVNEEFYGKMKKTAILINIARGGLLDYEATKKALESGSVAGLGTDVTWNEPFDPTDPVARHDRTIITPHVGGVTRISYEAMARIMATTVKQVKNNEPLTLVEVVNDIF